MAENGISCFIVALEQGIQGQRLHIQGPTLDDGKTGLSLFQLNLQESPDKPNSLVTNIRFFFFFDPFKHQEPKVNETAV